jgi:hypothetical protein
MVRTKRTQPKRWVPGMGRGVRVTKREKMEESLLRRRHDVAVEATRDKMELEQRSLLRPLQPTKDVGIPHPRDQGAESAQEVQESGMPVPTLASEAWPPLAEVQPFPRRATRAPNDLVHSQPATDVCEDELAKCARLARLAHMPPARRAGTSQVQSQEAQATGCNDQRATVDAEGPVELADFDDRFVIQTQAEALSKFKTAKKAKEQSTVRSLFIAPV